MLQVAKYTHVIIAYSNVVVQLPDHSTLILLLLQCPDHQIV